MNPFIYGNKTIEFVSKSGEVVGYNTIVKTHVSGGGGGGYTNQGTGYSAPVTISSSNEVIQKFFLKEDNNQETSFTFTNREIPLRDGQKITIIDGRDGKTGGLARIVNHNADRFWYAESGWKLAKNWGLIKRTWHYFLLGFSAWIVLAALLYSVVDFWSLWFIMFAGTVVYVKIKTKSNEKIVKKLDEHMDELAREVLRSH